LYKDVTKEAKINVWAKGKYKISRRNDRFSF
jgi:hypothetical protein